ncbi:Uncharacterized protein GBIM_20680 [Gryllus bimaculatus]|nr:Uncharacterized protein GBIM_20680 [Gryllus bimaculatus]
MFRPLCTMPLPGLLSSKLRELGFMYCDDVCIDRNGKPILDPVAEKVLRQWSDEPCTYWKELLATPATKNAFSHLQVRLIVIDSITFPLQTIDNALQRVSLLYDLMENLRTIASEFDVAVVVTNNLTTKVETEKESSLIPALGESFGHSVNYRFLLGRMSDSNFVCVSGKNLNKSSLTVPFQITRSGIREVQNN